MPTAPVTETTDIGPEREEMLTDPEVRAAWEAKF